MPELKVRPDIFETFLRLNDPENRISIPQINRIVITFSPFELETVPRKFQAFKNLEDIDVNVLKSPESKEGWRRNLPRSTLRADENHQVISHLIAMNKKIVFVAGSPVDSDICTFEQIHDLLKSSEPEEVAVEWVRQFIYTRPSPIVRKLSDLLREDKDIFLITTNVSNHFKMAGSPSGQTFYWVENNLEIEGDAVRIVMMVDIKDKKKEFSFPFVEDADAIIYIGVGLRGTIAYLAHAARRAVKVYVGRKDRNLNTPCDVSSIQGSMGCDPIWRDLSYTKLVGSVESLFGGNKLEPSLLLEKRRECLG